MKEIWKTKLKNGIFGSEIFQISTNSDVFYIGDGIGSHFSSMKLRKLSLNNGEEIKSLSIKNLIRCHYYNTETKKLFVVLDKKIVQIDLDNFNIIKVFDNKINRYSDYISSDNKNNLLLMSSIGSYLSIYNIKEGIAKKKKLKSCCGIFAENDNNFIISSKLTGTITRYNLKNNELRECLKTSTLFFDTYIGKTNLYIHLGSLPKSKPNTHYSVAPLNQIDLYNKLNFIKHTEIKFDFDIEQFIVSKCESNLYLICKNIFRVYSLVEKKVIEEKRFDEKVRIAKFFEEHRIIIVYEISNSNIITAYRI